MKKKKLKRFRKIRLIVDISFLILVAAFFIFTPTIGNVPGKFIPSVKADYVSEPIIPNSRDIPAPDLTATGIYVSDLDTGIVLYDKNPHEQLKPASLTKIMTALVALDYYPEDFVLSVINGESSVGATAKLVKGDRLTFETMMEALLIPSGNDAAVTLAENYPGGYVNFVAKMNSKAHDLGLVNSHFANVSGVESPNHYTSAYDIAMIAKSALKRNLFSNIVSTQKTTITSLKGYHYPLETTNKLLGEPGVLGVKTGWTPEAGECLVTLVNRDNHPILVSLLNSKDRFGESEKLINWIYQNYSWE